MNIWWRKILIRLENYKYLSSNPTATVNLRTNWFTAPPTSVLCMALTLTRRERAVVCTRRLNHFQSIHK